MHAPERCACHKRFPVPRNVAHQLLPQRCSRSSLEQAQSEAEAVEQTGAVARLSLDVHLVKQQPGRARLAPVRAQPGTARGGRPGRVCVLLPRPSVHGAQCSVVVPVAGVTAPRRVPCRRVPCRGARGVGSGGQAHALSLLTVPPPCVACEAAHGAWAEAKLPPARRRGLDVAVVRRQNARRRGGALQSAPAQADGSLFLLLLLLLLERGLQAAHEHPAR